MKVLWRLLAVFMLSVPAFSQQQADLTFDASVKNPAYTTTHPKVLFDEAHFNFHTTTGRYKPFADLIGNDGYSVTPNRVKFTKESLSGFDVLVIANAGAAQATNADRRRPAFTNDECDAVREWVRAGGALLLIADHAPAGPAAAILATRFGVDMSQGYTADPLNYERVALARGARSKLDSILTPAEEPRGSSNRWADYASRLVGGTCARRADATPANPSIVF
jgi:hypothetical protein